MLKQNPLHASNSNSVFLALKNFHDIFCTSDQIVLFSDNSILRPSESNYYGDPADALEATKTEAKEPRFGQLWDEIVDFHS